MSLDEPGREGRGGKEAAGMEKGTEKKCSVGECAFKYWYGKGINRNKHMLVELIKGLLTSEQRFIKNRSKHLLWKEGKHLMKAQRGWRKGFEAKCAQERERFSTSHRSPSAFVCKVPVHGQGFIGEHSAGQSSGAGTGSSGTETLLLTTLFQGANPSKENK